MFENRIVCFHLAPTFDGGGLRDPNEKRPVGFRERRRSAGTAISGAEAVGQLSRSIAAVI